MSTEILLILLLGGRIQPAAMTVLQLQPDAIACITSRDEPSAAPRLASLVKLQFPDLPVSDPVSVSAYSPIETQQAIKSIAEQFPTHKIVLSLTGTAMPMAIAGYEMARQLNCPAYYLNTIQGELIDLAHAENISTVRISLSVENFLISYQLQSNPAQSAKSQQILSKTQQQALDWIIQGLPETGRLLYLLNAPERERQNHLTDSTIRESYQAALLQLAAIGILQTGKQTQTETNAFRILSQADKRFLQGDWLEYLVYHTAKNLQQDGELLFDSLACGYHFQSNGGAEREIDFIAVRRGAGMIASCKTGIHALDKANLDELSSVGKALGDNYCTKLLITNYPRLNTHQDVRAPDYRALEHAKSAGAIIVFGDQLGQLKTILTREAITPTVARR